MTEREAADGLFDDLEVQIHQAVIQREQASDASSDDDTFAAMEVPIRRLTGATVLFTDLTIACFNGPPLRIMGLSFLADAMEREAFRIFRLYHGHPPRDE